MAAMGRVLALRLGTYGIFMARGFVWSFGVGCKGAGACNRAAEPYY